MATREIFLDTETTGRSAYNDRIVEIAAVEVDENYRPVKVFHEYLYPSRSVGSSSRIHGLTDTFLEHRKSFKEIANRFTKFVEGATVYAHNLPFDEAFINAELSRCGLKPLSEYVQEAHDTLAWARAKICGPASLDALISRFGLDDRIRQQHHGALIDVELLIRVFLCLQGNETDVAESIDFSKIKQDDEIYQQSIDQKIATTYKKDDDVDDDYDDNEDFNDEVDGQDEVCSSGGRYAGSYDAKLDAIIDFALDHPFFNGDMYEDIQRQYDEKGYLSEAQEIAIDNVYFGFHLDRH